MKISKFFEIVRDLFLPQPRNSCPHCGGVRCIGVCQFDKKTMGNHQPDTAKKTTDHDHVSQQEKK